MPRDDRSLNRLYGEPVRRPGFEAGPGLAVWTVGLLLAAAGSVVLSVVSLGAATTPDAATVQLRDWGVLRADESWLALHADRPDSRSGCLITPSALIRWEATRPVSRLPLAGATVTRTDHGLDVHAASGEQVHCPSDPGSDLRVFEALVRGRTAVRDTSWHPGPDPRVAHLYE